MKCEKETPSKELVDYQISNGTCGMTERVELMKFPIRVCKECNEEWVATDRYLARVHWVKREHEFAHHLLNFESKSPLKR